VRLAHLQISHVRNLSQVEIELVDGLNLFVGANGAGKTSLLEAVHLLARGRSFRTTRIGSVIGRDAESLWVHADLVDEVRGVVSVGLQKRRDNVAEARIDGVPQRHQSRVAELLPLQLLLPDGADLVMGGPGERRRFLDWGMFHVEPHSLSVLREYQRVLRQRNALLRSAHRRGEPLASEAMVWTERAAVAGERVDDLRRRYVGALAPVLAEVLEEIAPEVPAAITYQSGWPEGASLGKSLSESLPRDVKFGTTHAGPHRAELRLRSDGEPAAETLSRGQAKALATALRLAQARHTMAVAGRRSLFLVDDLGAELDRQHSERFFAALEAFGCQVLATTTALPGHRVGFWDRQRTFHVERGCCRVQGQARG
jgi:DNA replication and repair protein RecF